MTTTAAGKSGISIVQNHAGARGSVTPATTVATYKTTRNSDRILKAHHGTHTENLEHALAHVLVWLNEALEGVGVIHTDEVEVPTRPT
jgi:hypothetical protein